MLLDNPHRPLGQCSTVPRVQAGPVWFRVRPGAALVVVRPLIYFFRVLFVQCRDEDVDPFVTQWPTWSIERVRQDVFPAFHALETVFQPVRQIERKGGQRYALFGLGGTVGA